MPDRVRITWKCECCGTKGALICEGPITRRAAYMCALSDHQMTDGTIKDAVTKAHLELLHFKMEAIPPASIQQCLSFPED